MYKVLCKIPIFPKTIYFVKIIHYTNSIVVYGKYLYMFYLISVFVGAQEWLNVTSISTALMSDLRIDLLEPGVAVKLYEVKNDNNTLMGTIAVDTNWQNVTIHCGVITKGGRYLLQLVSNDTAEEDDIFQVHYSLN